MMIYLIIVTLIVCCLDINGFQLDDKLDNLLYVNDVDIPESSFDSQDNLENISENHVNVSDTEVEDFLKDVRGDK